MDPDLEDALDVAQVERALVRLWRGIEDSNEVEGFVVLRTEAWVVLANLDPSICLDGFVAVRSTDVDEVEERGPFAVRALQLRGDWPPVAPPVLRAASTEELLTSSGLLAPLVTIHVERVDPEVCYVGRPVGVTAESLLLHEVTPQAELEPDPTSWDLADVTRIDVGGRYEAALALVLGLSAPGAG